MGANLDEIAKGLDGNKRVQLIYAFNGAGKTRLSRKFKTHIEDKSALAECDAATDFSPSGVLYYSAFTEDLFYWDNDLEADSETNAKPRLKIQPNIFTQWLIKLLKDLGEDANIVTNFQQNTGSKINPVFNEEYKQRIKNSHGEEVEIIIPAYFEIVFKVADDTFEEIISNDDIADDETDLAQGRYKSIKISKGEESNFIWSIFFTLLQQVVAVLNEPKDDRITDNFNNFEYVFIDDPVSSLDDSHLIKLAVNLAELIKSSSFNNSKGLKFIVTTHNPLFYNVLYNELQHTKKGGNPYGTSPSTFNSSQSNRYVLTKKLDGSFDLSNSNDHPFAYHLFLLTQLQLAVKEGNIRKYHFNFLRNILEKTATFLGHKYWSDLLPSGPDGSQDPLANRILNLASHSAHAGEEVADIEESDKDVLAKLVSFLSNTYHFKEH